ncbi:Protein-glutamine gamma-glutamyltransferase [Bacillus sp. THAF10]|uniref:protein-glutamine gamma-glutamyltransferase n=1 Tax=Bacillus sp. THAF10 TaxID=2587848 RepID=UPI001268E756|nr:protein-glutamine gamma-glutamyltransferase [Bacillus sp. THAF10]QFT89267.1 Protein-glutamine gamma-glutamyltransferase [Bacillus sp. THAF10]
MIEVAGKSLDESMLNLEESFQKDILNILLDDSSIHEYDSVEELKFELAYRQNLVISGTAMSEGEARFETFAGATCNPDFWQLTPNGGFLLKKTVSPSDAIIDIFTNSSNYAFECATAMVINLYHGLLLTIGKRLFDKLFKELYLYSWHFDADLVMDSSHTYHLIPGDIVYFDNPDYNPMTFWWRGENALYMGSDQYFGHGIGIQSKKYIVDFLNSTALPEATRPATLTDYVARPDFRQLSKILGTVYMQSERKQQHTIIHHNKSSISCHRYLQLLHNLYFST